jgi:CubicO group peptidase (beta-lactamase class C family)
MEKYVMGKTEQSAKAASFDQKKLDRLSEYYAALVDSGRVQGAGFLLARNGKVFADQAYGRLSSEAGREKEILRPDSIKRIASITKVFTATAIMQLVEDGKLWLEQSVSTIIPEFDTPMHKCINLWHLLTHTSGLPADGGYFLDPYPIDRYDMMQKDDWLKKAVLCGPLQNKPGEAWNYCTIGFSVLSEIVSRSSGMHFNDYVESKIFKALGMDRSFLEVPVHLRNEVIISSDWGLEALNEPCNRTLCPNGGGGAYSTMGDMNRFAQAFLNKGEWGGARILSKKAVEEMTRNQLSGVPSFHWGANCKNYRQGLGWGFYADGSTVGSATYNHEGWGWCSLFIDPVENFTFISFIPDSNNWDPEVMVKPRTIAFSGLM